MDVLTAEQLAEWEAYDKIDPIGTWRDDYRIAVLDSLLLNIVSKLYTKKGHTPKEISPMEFMPNWASEKRVEQRQSVDDMKRVLLQIAEDAKRNERNIERSKRPPMAFKARPQVQKPTRK